MRRPAIILAAALAIGAITGLMVHQHTRSTLMNDAFTRLNLYHDLRKATLEDYMRSKASDVIAMSRNARVLDALGKFESAWSKIPSDAATVVRRLYIEDNPSPEGRKRDLRSASDESEYTEVHAPFHDWARRFLEHFGYYDLFLIDRRGNIIYTVEKEDDFATNLNDGPYADSPLGSVFQRALKSKAERAIISDYERYAPSKDAPALFAGCAIRTKDGDVAGIFAVQLPADPINAILRFTGGMGKTGETYIVGNDETMRSQSRFSTESTLLKTKVATASVSQGLAGFRGNHVIPDYRGVPVLSVFSPVDFGGPPWVLLAEIDEAEVLARMKLWPAIVAALIAAGLSAFLCYLALGVLLPHSSRGRT
ncbi:MAG: cache domain-containing protein [Methyloligellaceae bacterium]